jgi:hypothetical protein
MIAAITISMILTFNRKEKTKIYSIIRANAIIVDIKLKNGMIKAMRKGDIKLAFKKAKKPL